MIEIVWFVAGAAVVGFVVSMLIQIDKSLEDIKQALNDKSKEVKE